MQKVNKVVVFLTASDIFIWGANFVISTLTGLYLEGKLDGGIVRFIGIGTGIYFFSRALFQIPIGIIADKLKSDKDEIFMLFASSFLIGIPYMLYPYIEAAFQYYIFQFIVGIGTSMNLNSWRKLFAKNIDKNKEGREYAYYETAMSLATGALIMSSGVIANLNRFYFDLVIVGAGVISIAGGIMGAMIILVKNRKTNHFKLTSETS